MTLTQNLTIKQCKPTMTFTWPITTTQSRQLAYQMFFKKCTDDQGKTVKMKASSKSSTDDCGN